MTSTETNRRLVGQFWQAMNANDWQAGALFHDDFALE